MTILETLTQEQKFQLASGIPVGIFPSLIQPVDSFYNLSFDLCLSYYFERSGSKKISLPYDRLINLKEENSKLPNPETILGSMIRNKFIEKWKKFYSLLINEEYNSLDEVVRKENITRNNTDTTTYNTHINTDGNRASKSTTSYNDEDSNDVYGFNSVSPVGSDTSSSNYIETVSGDAKDNTSHTEENKTGTDSKTFIHNENKNISGRDSSPADLISKELDLRSKYIFFEVIFNDIDSIATSGVY